MKLRFITPYSPSLNIGGEYNQCISELTDDCYVVLRDGDTMFLTPDWGKHIEEIISENPGYDLITCVTNRIGFKDLCVDGMFDCADIGLHLMKSMEINRYFRREVTPTPAAPGMLMIFHKSLWAKVGGFKENSIYFDKEFSRAVTKHGGKIGAARGLYLLHLYRFGQPNPREYKEHLKVK